MMAIDAAFAERNILPFLAFSTIIVVTLAIGLRTIFDVFASRGAEKRLTEAQKRVFEVQSLSPNRGSAPVDHPAAFTPDGLPQMPLNLNLASLFDLYSKQIDKYQAQTQSRATMSFLCAVASMLAGIGLLIWGGWQIVHPAASETGDGVLLNSHLLPGSVISVIGSAMSAFITKTFLDIHRTSLCQLNHYFKQPVLNSHILSAQRLSDLITSDVTRERIYQDLIKEVIALIAAEQAQPVDLNIQSRTNMRSASSRKHHGMNEGRARATDGQKHDETNVR